MLQSKQRAVLVIGKTGTGKSTFINQFTGSKLNVSSVECCTKQVAKVNYQGVDYIDTPGVGDMDSTTGKKLTNDEILNMILSTAVMYDVICVVVMIMVPTSRPDADVVDLIQKMGKRYGNLPLLLECGVKNEDEISTEKIQTKFLLQKDIFQKLGFSIENLHICTGTNGFHSLNAKLKKKLGYLKPEILVSTNYLMICRNCLKLADPLLDKEKCFKHGEAGNKQHEDVVQYHTHPAQDCHPGYIVNPTCSARHYSCCTKSPGSLGCRFWHPCCRGASGSVGCQKKCSYCDNNIETAGCKNSCKNCGSKQYTKGCITVEHDFVEL